LPSDIARFPLVTRGIRRDWRTFSKRSSVIKSETVSRSFTYSLTDVIMGLGTWRAIFC
jgi:hypothetical protein